MQSDGEVMWVQSFSHLLFFFFLAVLFLQWRAAVMRQRGGARRPAGVPEGVDAAHGERVRRIDEDDARVRREVDALASAQPLLYLRDGRWVSGGCKRRVRAVAWL